MNFILLSKTRTLVAQNHDGRRVARRVRRLWRLGSWVLGALALLWLWPATLGGATTVAVVSGNSMEPTYSSGDLVVVRRRDTYQLRDVAMVQLHTDKPGSHLRVLHRVIAIDELGGVTTQGDNRATPDGFTTQPDDVVGRVLFHVPAGGRVMLLLSRWWFLALATGGFVGVVILRWAIPPEDEAPPINSDSEPEHICTISAPWPTD